MSCWTYQIKQLVSSLLSGAEKKLVVVLAAYVPMSFYAVPRPPWGALRNDRRCLSVRPSVCRVR